MTNDMSKVRSSRASDSVNGNVRAASHSRTQNANDRRVNGYSRVKSGELKRRSVTRSPDMSNPSSRAANPNVALGRIDAKLPVKNKAVPVASVRVEPKIRTVTDTAKVSFPYSVVFLSLICSLLFFYMIFNYVQINESTANVSDLKYDIATLSFEADELNTKLDMKNDLTVIEKIATEKLGMVKIDEIIKKYITMDSGDVITPFDLNENDSSSK